MPNWTLSKWAGGISSDEYYGQEGTYKHVAGLRCGQDLRYVTPSNAAGTPIQTFTSGGTHSVKGIYSLEDMGISAYVYSTRQSNTQYLYKDATQVFTTGSYYIENFAPQSISGTPNLIYQTYGGAVYKNAISNISGSSWTLNLVGTAAASGGYGCYSVSLDGAALLLAQGNALHTVNAAGTFTRHFYIGDSAMGANSYGGNFVGLTKFADQVRAYMYYRSPKIFFFQASEIAGQAAGSVSDSSNPSYSIDLPNVSITAVVNDGPTDYIIGSEHGYPVILALNGYTITRVYSGKTRAYSTTYSAPSYNGSRGTPVKFYQGFKDFCIVSGKRLYASAYDAGAPANTQSGYVSVYGGLSQDGIDNGFSLRNLLPGASERALSMAYSTGNQLASTLIVGTNLGNVYNIPCEATTSSAFSQSGYLITRDFDGGLYSARKSIDEINLGCEIGSTSSLEFAISTDSSNQPNYKVIKTFAGSDVLNGRVRIVPPMITAATGGLGEFNKVSYRIKLTNGSATECRLYDVDTRWKFIKQ